MVEKISIFIVKETEAKVLGGVIQLTLLKVSCI